MKEQQYSDEILNAYVDGELSADDNNAILNSMKSDKALLRRVRDLERVKSLVGTSFNEVPNSNYEKSIKGNKPSLSIAASVLLLLGVVSGWIGHDLLNKDETSTQIVVSEKKDTWNIVLHVNTNDKYIQKTILDETESLLESFKDSEKKAKVEIVAYGQGVFLFDKSKSKYQDRLESLKNNFTNLSYAVCGRTLKRIEQKQDRKINLIADMTISRSGIYQIIKRQKQGWNYIRI